MIPLVPSITRFARVPVPHTNDATYALDAHGNEWIAKREADMGCEALLAEALTWLLARQIGVRVPDAAFCDDPEERAWLSRRVPDAVHWSSVHVASVANPGETGAIIALDAIVFNEARHGRNLLATGSGLDPEMTVWAIDADEARVGHVVEFAALGGAAPDPRIHALRFPAAKLRTHALAAATAAARLSPALLQHVVTESCRLAREPRVEELATALGHRCGLAYHRLSCPLRGSTMTARTRLVYFIIDPYTDIRAPVAALLQGADGTRVVRAATPRLTPSASFAVARALADIESGHEFDALPIGAGPQFVMGEPHTLPAGVADPSRWVLDHLLRAA